jgi:hypothetical protein
MRAYTLLLLGIFLTAPSRASDDPLKSTYCIIHGALSDGNGHRLFNSKKIDLDTSMLKSGVPDEKGICRHPSCRTTDEFGVRGELVGRIDTCTDCGVRDFQTLIVTYRGFEYGVPMNPSSEQTQLFIRPHVDGGRIKIGRDQYKAVYFSCKNQPQAGFEFKQ